MFALYLKEIKSFFNSIIGYVIIGVFLLMSGLFLWGFKMQTNIFEMRHATLQSFFDLAPWLFLFLIPALTMRTFSEERKSGTMELLLTHPVSDTQLVLSKFLACETLLLITLLPTLIYVFSVWKLGDPVGNIDLGSTCGSYIGLFLLGTIFITIGIFASAITHNQIVAFVLGATFCFLLHFGFEFIYNLDTFGNFGFFIKKFGIQHHYSAISTGVIDTRDIIYYITVSFLFLLGTRISLLSRKW
ncbi:MAG: gliding motility-associated ABC transporter permease subunit GldF [Bacteroidales bacterium]|nr:gliding motility-associated ABC transporter permease subunit GldF [Bacteroidales bacterium]